MERKESKILPFKIELANLIKEKCQAINIHQDYFCWWGTFDVNGQKMKIIFEKYYHQPEKVKDVCIHYSKDYKPVRTRTIKKLIEILK